MSGAKERSAETGAKRKHKHANSETEIRCKHAQSSAMSTIRFTKHASVHTLRPRHSINVHVHMYNVAGAALYACKPLIAPRDVLALPVHELVA